MDARQKALLSFFFIVFLLVAISFFWQYIARSRSSFLAGTNPIVADTEAPTPTLPPLRTTDPARGDASSKAVTIVTFADFSCLYCRFTEEELQKSLTKSSIPVRVVWRDFPVVTEHPEGLVAAIAGRCANDQGKFWQMHDALYQTDDFSPEALKALASRLQLNVSRFEECSTSEKHIAEIQSDIVLARQNYINGAPTIFVGKHVLSGYITADEFTKAIQAAAK